MNKKIFVHDRIMFNLGTIHLIIFALLCVYFPFNKQVVLGLNSFLKPIKFSLSIWIYSWTMALILPYFTEVKKVEIYTWVAVICMCFEQFAITTQALRGQLSHFNKTDAFGIIVYSLMGVFILTLTIWTGYMTFLFFKQKDYNLSPEAVLSIRIGMIYFVIFSLFGGYISGLSGHTVGAMDGGEGLFFLNWSKFFGDLRVAHFFGIHSLQIIPLFGIIILRYFKKKYSIRVIQLTSFYTFFS